MLAAEHAAARDFARHEKSDATRRAYRSDLAIFAAWCEARGLAVLPASSSTVAAFLAAEAQKGIRPSTLARRIAALRYAHRLAGYETPTSSELVQVTMRGIRRSLGASRKQKAPATAERMGELLRHVPDGLAGRRDRALLLLGFAGALRRSELVALRVEDLQDTTDGLRVTIRRSKTDQEGRGEEIAIPAGGRLRAVAATREWLAAADITSGPIFRPIDRHGRIGALPLTDRSVANIVKAYAACAGFDPSAFAGHSLRAGFLTSAAAHGANLFKMADQSRHKSLDVLRGYVRSAELFRDHAGSAFL